MNQNVYTRPNKPLTIPVRRRREPEALELKEVRKVVAVDKATECHVTPPDVAARMVEYLGEAGDYLTLEPSGGTGSLVRALLDSGHSDCELTIIERHHALASGLQVYGPVIQQCFLEYAEEAKGKIEFPRIIMNPPFSAVRKHIAAAKSLMGLGGHDSATLVALVPVTFDDPESETLESLPDDTFSTARVNTKIIRITHPD